MAFKPSGCTTAAPGAAEPRLQEDRPDLIFVLPWNLRDEVLKQLTYVNEWGGEFVTAVPKLNRISKTEGKKPQDKVQIGKNS